MPNKRTRKPKPTADGIEQVSDTLRGLDLMCDCGRLIERGGQEIVVIAVDRIDTPAGLRYRLRHIRRVFCSLDCDHLEEFRQAADATNPMLVVIRPVPTHTWFKKPSDYKPTPVEL
jgi:hypothetical protein